MSADTRSSPRRVSPFVAVLFGANALTQFAIQAWMAYGFADQVWQLAGPLPWLAPVALDVFAVTLMAATYSLRRAPAKTRAYVWFWLAVAIGAQVGASEGFADHEGWNAWGRVASLAPAIFLAASLHALIIMARGKDAIMDASDAPVRMTWRARRRARRDRKRAGRALGQAMEADRKATPAPRFRLVTAHTLASSDLGKRDLETVPPVAEVPAPPVKPEVTAPVEPPALPAPRAPRPRPAAKPAPVPTGTRGRGRPRDPRQDLVIKRVLDGDPPEDAKHVAEELGVHARTAQLWVAQERDRRATTSRSATAEGGA